MRTIKHILFGLSVCLPLLSGPLYASPASAAVPLSIPAQPMRDALNVLAKQTGLQLLFSSEEITDAVKAPRIHGTLTPEAALKQLLANTGFYFEFVNARTVAIRSTKPSSKPTSLHQSGGAGSAALALAEAKPDQKEGRSVESVEEMLVEGEREKPAPFSTANLDLTRTEEDVLSFTVFDAKDIQLSGAANLQDFLQKRLTQNFNPNIVDEMDGGATEYYQRQSRVNMRGWGDTETVFLLNGRRMPAEHQGTNIDTSNATPNLQGIPLASIERIEILPSAGSAIYGENATGGVINIITRQDFRGGQLSVSYATPADVHAPRRSVDLSYGVPLKLGIGLRLSAGYSDKDPLHAGDRAAITIERWRRLMMERAPQRVIEPIRPGNPFFTWTSFLFGATPNIHATNFSVTNGKPGNLFADLPGATASNFTSVPDGYAGNGTLADFQPGTYNLGLAAGADGSGLHAMDSTLGPADANSTVSLGVDKSFGERWRWSIDYKYSQNDSEGQPNGRLVFNQASAISAQTRVPASASINPFGQDVTVYLIDPRMQRPELINKPTNVTWALSSTLRGALGQWRGFLDFSYSQNRNRHLRNDFIEPTGGWRQAFMDGRYNPFVDVRTVAPAAAGFYEDYIAKRDYTDSASRNYQSGIKLSGPVLSLSTGAAQLTVGGDWSRSERYLSSTYTRYQDGLTGELRLPVCCTPGINQIPPEEDPARRFSFDSYAAYAEGIIPVLSARQAVPLVRQLELFGSGRISFATRNGFAHGYQGGKPNKYNANPHVYATGLRYDMLEGMAFRISQSIGYKPPSIDQAIPFTPIEQGFAADYLLPVDDLRRGVRVSLPVTAFRRGGNPDLLPETTTSTNVGWIFTPRWVSGLRLSVDYLESIRGDAIADFSTELLMQLESEYPPRVQRGAPDGHPSGVGPITYLDMSLVNFREVISRSVDFSIGQQLQDVFGGGLMLSAAATRQLSFKYQYTATSLPLELVRNIDGTGGSSYAIQWNANAQLQWQGRQWGFGWGLRYFDYMLMHPAVWAWQGGDRVPWKLDHDLNINYRAPALRNPRGMQWLLSGTSVTFGVSNLFDRKPRFYWSSTDRGIAPYDSIEGRSVWLRMNKSFE